MALDASRAGSGLLAQQLSRHTCVFAEFGACDLIVDGRTGRAVLAACAARRWLARNAADVKLIRGFDEHEAAEWTSLSCCLPSLEDVLLVLDGVLTRDDLVCMLEALAGCPRLSALNVSVDCISDTEGEGFANASTFAKLRSLTKLYLRFDDGDPLNLTDVICALAALTGLMDLFLGLPQAAVVPAALGQFKGLQSVAF